jgi:hypothetical protein
VVLIGVGALFFAWSLMFRPQMAVLRRRVAQAGDVERFDRMMRPYLKYAPPIGA